MALVSGLMALRSLRANLMRTLLTLLGALFIVDWQLTLMATVFIVAVVLPLRTLGKKARKASQGAIAAGVQQSSQVVEALAGIRVVKAYGLEQEQVSRFRDLADRLLACLGSMLLYWYHHTHNNRRIELATDDDSIGGHFLHLLH